MEEFSPGTPFRDLAEARFWGQDLLREKYGDSTPVQRMEIGTDAIDCAPNDWLIFKDRKWQKISDLEKSEGLPIAHVKTASPQALEMEGWDGTSHIRLKMPISPLPPLKIRGEELFSQLRVRSEKQISCIMDKQCLILRAGDWVVRSANRWKIVRKKEEKALFLEGKIVGELFVLDRIDSKGAVKSIAGQCFSARRTQALPIEFAQPVQKRSARPR